IEWPDDADRGLYGKLPRLPTPSQSSFAKRIYPRRSCLVPSLAGRFIECQSLIGSGLKTNGVDNRMITKNLESWESFEEEVFKFFDVVRTIRTEESPLGVSIPIFRGHANASWKLQTTLERFSVSLVDVHDYHRTIRSVRPAVVSLTEKNWDIPDMFAIGALPPT